MLQCHSLRFIGLNLALSTWSGLVSTRPLRLWAETLYTMLFFSSVSQLFYMWLNNAVTSLTGRVSISWTLLSLKLRVMQVQQRIQEKEMKHRMLRDSSHSMKITTIHVALNVINQIQSIKCAWLVSWAELSRTDRCVTVHTLQCYVATTCACG